MTKCPKCLSDFSQDGYSFCPMDGTKLMHFGGEITSDDFAKLDRVHKELSRRMYRCENCNLIVDVDVNSGSHANCDFVYGRRGWRQLGAYDG